MLKTCQRELQSDQTKHNSRFLNNYNSLCRLLDNLSAGTLYFKSQELFRICLIHGYFQKSKHIPLLIQPWHECNQKFSPCSHKNGHCRSKRSDFLRTLKWRPFICAKERGHHSHLPLAPLIWLQQSRRIQTCLPSLCKFLP